jgi:predicted DNA-binding transcriptional regulator AlpA
MSAEPTIRHPLHPRSTAADQAQVVESQKQQALLTDIVGLSRLLCRSVAALERDQAAGRIPRPLRIGRSKRWPVAEIAAWIEAGCPDRRTWEFRRKKG